ncbi:hypothetical protein R4B61_05770 [Fructilactobacillus vespulae]|uniref:hypothetical protein n=1 Tax=Fructilactobacillus vespulae TaxID=1249630 RepID=UPI0039B39FBF
MYLKRFIELLVVYSFSFSLAIILTGIKTSLLRLFIGILIGYLVLVIPLTFLTIKKMKKRNAVSGSNLKNKNRFQTVLDALPAFLYLATQDGNKVISN